MTHGPKHRLQGGTRIPEGVCGGRQGRADHDGGQASRTGRLPRKGFGLNQAHWLGKLTQCLGKAPWADMPEAMSAIALTTTIIFWLGW